MGMNGRAFDDADWDGAGGIADRRQAERLEAHHWYRKSRGKDKHLGLADGRGLPEHAG
jgi:hypothetical protein